MKIRKIDSTEDVKHKSSNPNRNDLDPHETGKVIREADTPRSYIVKTPTGNVRRNRLSLSMKLEQSQLSQKSQLSQQLYLDKKECS